MSKSWVTNKANARHFTNVVVLEVLELDLAKEECALERV
jgi:hypothetical protein